MTHKTIYIAGKVSGEDLEKREAKFKAAENALKERYSTVINPVQYIQQMNEQIIMSGGRAWDDMNDRKSIMKICIEILMDCDEIYLMEDWQQSQGAVLEGQIAKSLGLEVIYEQ